MTVLRVVPVSWSVKTTVAFGIKAPDLSATTPVTFPVACWPHRGESVSTSTAISSTTKKAVGLILENSSIVVSPVQLRSICIREIRSKPMTLVKTQILLQSLE